MRIKTEEQLAEEKLLKAQEGHRLTKIRVRDEQKRDWLETLPKEARQRILLRKAARLQSSDHRDQRKQAIVNASIHTWTRVDFNSWFYNSLIKDLQKQFRIIQTTTKTGVIMNASDSRRCAISIDVLTRSYSNILTILAESREEDLFASIDVNVEESCFSSLTLSDHGALRELKEVSSISIDMRRPQEMKPVFEFISKLLSLKLSSLSSSSHMCKAVRYVYKYAKVRLDSDDLSSSLENSVYESKMRILEVEALRQTYLVLIETAEWVARSIQLDSASEWVELAKTWMATVILERYAEDGPGRLRGEGEAASRIIAGYRGLVARRLVARVWRLADEELMQQAEVEDASQVESQLRCSSLHLGDVVDELIAGKMVTDSAPTNYSMTSPDQILALESLAPTVPLTIRKVLSEQNGFTLTIHIDSANADAAGLQTLGLLSQVCICVGYLTTKPVPLLPALHDAPILGASLLLPFITSTITSDFPNSYQSPGKLVLLLVDARKDWNFPYGLPCEVNLSWPTVASTRKNKLFCNVRISGLLPFCTYDVDMKVDMFPLESAIPCQDNSSRPPVYNFKRDLIDFTSLTLHTEKSLPSAPKYIYADILYLDETLLVPSSHQDTRIRSAVKITWSAAVPNGGYISKYEIQRLVILAAPQHEGKVDTHVWQLVDIISPLMDLSFQDSSLIEPFVVQYRVRAINTVGMGPYVTSIELGSDATDKINSFGQACSEYDDPFKPRSQISNSFPATANRKAFLFGRSQKQSGNIDRIVSSIVGDERPPDNCQNADEEWLHRLAKAGPFDYKSS
jgi:hypothetical protein